MKSSEYGQPREGSQCSSASSKTHTDPSDASTATGQLSIACFQDARDQYKQRRAETGASLGYRSITYSMSGNLDWKRHSQLEIKLDSVPQHYTTWNIYERLSKHGNIVKINIMTLDTGGKRAFVKFQPPPDRAFWEDRKSLQSMSVCLPRPKNWNVVPGPATRTAQFPPHIALIGTSIEFGFMLSEDSMMSMCKFPDNELEFAIDLKEKGRENVSINFHIRGKNRNNVNNRAYYRLQIKLNKLREINVQSHENADIMVISLDAPPELFRKMTDVQKTHADNNSFWQDWYAMRRQTEIVFDEEQSALEPASLHQDSALLDIGRWTTYRLTFPRTKTLSMQAIPDIQCILASYDVQIHPQTIKVCPRATPTAWNLLDPGRRPAAQTSGNYIMDMNNLLQGKTYPLRFATRYQLEVCISHGFLHENNMSEDFIRQLWYQDQKDQTLAVGILERVATLKRRFFNPMEIFSLQVSSVEVVATKNPPVHCTVARSATITATRVYFNPPAIEISNRVVRHWSDYSDRFLRVRFADELCYGKIKSDDGPRNQALYKRVTRVLRNGIILGDRKYEFLAFGSSQFREHGAYFFAPTNDLKCHDIRSLLGELDENDRRLPAKFCARIGQNFSTTRGLSVKVKVQVYRNDNSSELILPDVARNGYTFTDGVGKISSFLAKIIASEFRLPVQDAPSVFQFRMGGCKGVLAVDTALRGYEIQIRPSQYKFAAIHDGLEIIRASSYASASLNRQIIVVLSALGVSDGVFLDKMRCQLKALELTLNDEAVALHELQSIVDGNQITLMMANMIQGGFMTVKEPFVMALLTLWRSWTLKYLKEKAKLPIEDGAFLLGTVDETATLRGHFDDNKPLPTDSMQQRISKLPEVFCRVDRQRKGVYETISGVCILVRNPSLHPGDIRVVRAVDVPKLYHITNSIVFPQTGDRDISNMCSGGDLDGDDYLLIWDKSLIPREWNYPPMDFTAAKPVPLDRDVTAHEMTQFFVDYIKSDNLAIIATNHLAFADHEELGVMDEKCLRLAELHSLAVDYPKSGQAVVIPQDLKKPRWPHFMEKARTYHSNKILGQLYDLVIAVDGKDFHPDYSHTFDRRILDAFSHNIQSLNRVKTIKAQYDSRIHKIMAQHSIDTEFEIWTGFVMHHNKEKKDYSISEELGTLMEALRANFRKICENSAGGRDPESLHPFVAAMYTVTAQEAKAASGEEPTMISFPWLFLQELTQIAVGGTHFQSAHRVQRVQKRARTSGGLLEDDYDGDIETQGGSLAHDEVLWPFEWNDDELADASS